MPNIFNNSRLGQIINENAEAGAHALYDTLQYIYPTGQNQAELLVTIHPDDYSATSIAHAVEDCNHHLINLNVTSQHTENGWPIIALRTNGNDSSSVARSLSRYGYHVIDASDCTTDGVNNHEAQYRIEELLHLLKI